MIGPLEQRFRDFLRDLDPAPLAALAEAYRKTAFDLGLRVLKADGSWWAIPPALTPVVEQTDSFAARSQLAHHLLSGVAKVARHFLGGDGKAQADQVFAGLAPWERALVDQTWRDGEQVATARADLFDDAAGAARPLEMNATIPAMQGYADIAARAFISAVAAHAGIPPSAAEAIAAKNGSNVDDLRRSLLAHAEKLGIKSKTPSIALVARPNDAQSGEQDYLAAQFRAAGLDARRCVPAELDSQGPGKPTVNGKPVDLIYRHVFVRNVPAELPFAKMLRDPLGQHILNPPNSQLEVKALFAELSAAGSAPHFARALGLSAAEISSAQRIPWSRRVQAGPSSDFEGAPLQDLLAFARDRAEQLVLKRSWGYGGTSVLLGDEIDSETGQARARDLLGLNGTQSLSWAELLDRCASAGGFVLQRKVELHTEKHLVASASGPEWVDWYVDISAFTNLGVDVRPSGGVRRGSKSRIVNIVGGGGLVPALHTEVMTDLLAALRA